MSAERPTANNYQEVAQSLRAIPESLRKAFDDMKPEGFDWDRVEAAMDVLKGEKIAVVPKPPEPEPTESQKFYRDMYRSGKLTPYQRERPGVSWEAIQAAWKDPQTQGETNKIMAVDMAIRGGADKEYNKLGGLDQRAKRIGVMAGNMLPNIVLDIATSIPQNLAEKAVAEVLKGKLAAAMKLPEEDVDKSKTVSRLGFQIKTLRSTSRLIGVMNDKNVTAFGDTLMHHMTGEKQGWFTGESSDKLNDLVTTGFPEYVEDFVNGPTIESTFRMVYQVPVIGALVEQAWTRWSLFQSKSAYHKGNLKAVYASVGMLIGLLRNAESHESKTPSWWLTNKIWNGGSRIINAISGTKPVSSAS